MPIQEFWARHENAAVDSPASVRRIGVLSHPAAKARESLIKRDAVAQQDHMRSTDTYIHSEAFDAS